jgi:hypothetical protein
MSTQVEPATIDQLCVKTTHPYPSLFQQGFQPAIVSVAPMAFRLIS